MVSLLALYSDDPSSSPAEAYNFSVMFCLKRMKINKKRLGLAHFFKKTIAGTTILIDHLITCQKSMFNIKDFY